METRKSFGRKSVFSFIHFQNSGPKLLEMLYNGEVEGCLICWEYGKLFDIINWYMEQWLAQWEYGAIKDLMGRERFGKGIHMKFQSIEKMHDGKFIHRYDISYQTEDGNKKIYEMISRDPDVRNLDDLRKKMPDAVVLIIHDEGGERLLLNREFRLAIGDWVYNFPAGLIDAGEMPEESARRELKEETGLDLLEIKEQLALSYSAVGFANETNVCLVGTAGGVFQKSHSSAEEIEAGWFTKAEVRELLRTEPFAARTQAYCYLWSKM